MGKGAGGIDTWISYVKKGKIIIEVNGVSKKLAFIAFKAVQYRISLKMDIIEREVIDA
jgi:ribosomal protein L16/L10AE